MILRLDNTSLDLYVYAMHASYAAIFKKFYILIYKSSLHNPMLYINSTCICYFYIYISHGLND